jgi:hypothetical protein
MTRLVVVGAGATVKLDVNCLRATFVQVGQLVGAECGLVLTRDPEWCDILFLDVAIVLEKVRDMVNRARRFTGNRPSHHWTVDGLVLVRSSRAQHHGPSIGIH